MNAYREDVEMLKKLVMLMLNRDISRHEKIFWLGDSYSRIKTKTPSQRRKTYGDGIQEIQRFTICVLRLRCRPSHMIVI